MVDLNDLVISSNLSVLLLSLSAHKGIHSPRLNLTRDARKAVRLKKDASLPDNIDLFVFSRFVKENFVEPSCWGQSSKPLSHAIIKSTSVKDNQKCMQLNKTILRFAFDGSIKGAALKIYSDYIINTAISNPSLADELLVQVASLTRIKPLDPGVSVRLWGLLAHCLSCICPSPRLHTYLLKYVSDHGKGNFAGHLQNHLLVMPKNHLSTENRSYPPTVIEWDANNTCSNMALEIYLPDDSVALIGVDPWATSEEVANAAVQSKGYESPQGWSLVLEQDNGLSTEISGNDYVLDLISSLELYPGLKFDLNTFLKYDRSDLKNLDKVDRKEMAQLHPMPPSQALILRSNDQSGNFSFGQPNLQSSIQAHSNEIHRYSVDQASGSVYNNKFNSRIKGGGKMMGMNGIGYHSGMGMMQQQPMMLNQQMMPMQSMQPQMMQPFGQPMMQMQPHISMQQQQPFLGMPSSIGMMSTGINPTQQQMMMQFMKQQRKQEKKWMKMMAAVSSSDDEMGQQRNIKDDSIRARKQSFKHEKEHKPTRRNTDSWSSDEEHARRQKNDDRRSRERHGRASDKARDMPLPSPQKGESQNRPERRSSDSDKSETDWKISRQKAIEKKERDSESQEGGALQEINQGTSQMSFLEKKKFFMQKAMAESQTSVLPEPRRAHKVSSFQKAGIKNEALSREVKTDTKVVVPEAETSSPMPPMKSSPKPLIHVKETETPKDHREEALTLLFGHSAEKVPKQKEKLPLHKEESIENTTHLGLLLSRQRRSISSKQQPPPPAQTAEPAQSLTTEPTHKTSEPVHDSPPSSPILLPSSSDDEMSPKDVTANAAKISVLTALLDRRQKLEEQGFSVQKESPPAPPTAPAPVVPKRQMILYDEDIKTTLHPCENRVHVKYTNVKWKLRARKEIFYSDEPISNMKLIDLIYQQIVQEVKNRNPRILTTYREQAKEFLDITQKKKIDPEKKQSFVEQCRVNWKLYFTQFFQIKTRDVPSPLPQTLYKATVVGVGHSGIHFAITHGIPEWQIFSFDFHEISTVQETQSNILELNIQGKKIALSCRKSNQLKKMILPCLVPTANSPCTSPKPTDPFDRIFDSKRGEPTEQKIKHEDIYEVLPPPEDTEQYSLLHFARQYFTKPKESEKSLQHTKSAMRKPLLNIRKEQIVKAAVTCFLTIQRFMGDASSKTTSEEASVYKLLSTSATFPRTPLIDEVYIYLAKQTTNNKKLNSCIRGWRLFALFAAFHPCSKALLPHLLAHLHNIANGPSEYANGAAVTLVNLQQTLEFKGRKEMPIDIEVKAIVAGRTTFEHLILLPGALQWQFKVNTSSVAAHVIEKFCEDLGISKPEEIAEYGIFCMAMDDMGKILTIDTLVRGDYLMDVLTKWRRRNAQVIFMFQRVVWAQPTDYENEKLVNILVQQIISEYTSGKLLTYQECSGNLTRSQIGEYAKTATLLHVGLGRTSLPTQEEVIQYIPQQIRNQQPASTWRDLSHNHFTTIQNRTTHEACSEALGILSAKSLFGATIFTEERLDSSGNAYMKTIAISSRGISIFDPNTKALEEQYSINCIGEVFSYYDEALKTNVCDINIKETEEDKLVMHIKTSKPSLLSGILNHHVSLQNESRLV